jgi:hypothetical protein
MFTLTTAENLSCRISLTVWYVTFYKSIYIYIQNTKNWEYHNYALNQLKLHKICFVMKIGMKTFQNIQLEFDFSY